MSIIETRTFTAVCGRRVVADCMKEVRISVSSAIEPMDEASLPSSLSSATAHFRTLGWRLGKVASCPACIAAWEGESTAAEADPEETARAAAS